VRPVVVTLVHHAVSSAQASYVYSSGDRWARWIDGYYMVYNICCRLAPGFCSPVQPHQAGDRPLRAERIARKNGGSNFRRRPRAMRSPPLAREMQAKGVAVTPESACEV